MRGSHGVLWCLDRRIRLRRSAGSRSVLRRTDRRNRSGLAGVDGWIETAAECAERRRLGCSRVGPLFRRSGGRVFDRRRGSAHLGTFGDLRFANGIALLRIVVFGHHELIPSALARRSSIGVSFGQRAARRGRLATMGIDLRHSITAQHKIVEQLTVRHWGRVPGPIPVCSRIWRTFGEEAIIQRGNSHFLTHAN
jgi:hypothetical protein